MCFSPLDGMDESVAFVEPAMLGHGTPRRRPVSVIALNGEYVSNCIFHFLLMKS